MEPHATSRRDRLITRTLKMNAISDEAAVAAFIAEEDPKDLLIETYVWRCADLDCKRLNETYKTREHLDSSFWFYRDCRVCKEPATSGCCLVEFKLVSPYLPDGSSLVERENRFDYFDDSDDNLLDFHEGSDDKFDYFDDSDDNLLYLGEGSDDSDDNLLYLGEGSDDSDKFDDKLDDSDESDDKLDDSDDSDHKLDDFDDKLDDSEDSDDYSERFEYWLNFPRKVDENA
ncbi:hypothetical protein P153DRAFT_360318 [Dothidotthia symphoricarpi CBS 119687]|uniref:Uncharacterized protein n=1 Tax=Dothidotthia symphoricarpi CBS 119687 TaxID=1392245 RepID=A0A6A5ZZZ4_9PLEO|nr:uncharacterized protein P153DRAFT_360318 [Dothidotthia symphoricarpi CBS 119687]KAF2125322.1 hypothetical protein P153DRAFT_360318 [Dothidotthia symphoricarpi CBS 119687]